MFGEKLDRKLIQIVKEHKVVYDCSDPKYLDFNAREVAWQKIGDTVRRPAQDCKTRWIHMRDVYRRILKKSLSSAGKRVQLYKYHNELAFLRPYFRDLFDTGNEQELHFEDDQDEDIDNVEVETPKAGTETIESDESESSDEEQVVVKRRATRKRVESKTSQQPTPFSQEKMATSFSSQDLPLTSTFDPNDQIDSFILSVSATLRKLTPYHLNLAKSKIFSIVQEHELQMIVDNPLNTEHNFS